MPFKNGLKMNVTIVLLHLLTDFALSDVSLGPAGIIPVRVIHRLCFLKNVSSALRINVCHM